MIEQTSSTLAELAPSAGGWAAGLATLAASVAIVRRRLSRDRTEMTKDRVESSYIEQLLDDRNAAAAIARQAFAERAADLQAIARLEATNKYQGEEIERLKREFINLRRLIVRLYPDAAMHFQDTVK